MSVSKINPNRFTGRCALITGCGSNSGIGFATAELLLRSGAKVAITSTTDRIFERKEELDKLGEVAAFVADLVDLGQVDTLVKGAMTAFKQIDILVNNAGMSQVGDSEDITPLSKMLHRKWHTAIDRNLTTCFNITRALLPEMVKNGYGRVVNVSSVTGPLVSNPGESAYSAAKAAMVGMSKSVAIEVGKSGVTINNVAPGWIGTDSSLEEERVAAQNTPMGRAGSPREVADLIAFLSSGEATYITGQTLVIDGGNTLQEYKGPSELYY
ncbi:SDR family NAD(P)-dependent oxidoreductase [uncultured Desulfuromonas sp.]|uniref:SDR family NAD(P)-dependent oxidoreductase n=1 Tax=uncultured Desulfuromonas sp. TaxID=181013 RepID=UPI002AAA90D3|nr:SDR family NAD(P)-dependent oxidoreductase [uncultured Desulfuromonas sp.]